MMTPAEQAKVAEAVRALGVLPTDFDAIRVAPFPRAVEMLKELKERARKNYKRLAFELHPDRTGNDPVKTERFKFFGEILSKLEALEVRPPPPMPQVQVHMAPVTWVQASARFVNTGASTTTTNVGGRGPMGAWVVFMRPPF